MKFYQKKSMLAVIGLSLLLLVGTTVAYFRAETSTSNKLSSGNIGIELVDTTNEKDSVIKDKEIIFALQYPGAVIDKQTYVRNIKNNDLYVRIKVTKFWEDKNGNKQSDTNASYIELLTKDNSNWIIKDEDRNHEVQYYYYRYPLKANSKSDYFINQIKLSGQINENDIAKYDGARINLDFSADAIQQMGAEKAMLSEWGLDVTIDQNGRINEVRD